jgi:hypothetical protein
MIIITLHPRKVIFSGGENINPLVGRILILLLGRHSYFKFSRQLQATT